MKIAVKWTYITLMVVAGAGLLMRALPFMHLPGLNFEFLRHAHSHLAFLGWVYPAFFLAFVKLFLPENSFEKSRYSTLFWWTLAAAAGMFIAFLMTGYGAISIGFLTLHTGLAYVFFFTFLKDWNLEKRKPSAWFACTAIGSFFLSSLGPFAIPVVQILTGGNPVWMKMAIQFYLHFHYNGWFVFGLLALLFKLTEKQEISISLKLAKWQWAVMTAGLFPAYFLIAPGFGAPGWLQYVVQSGIWLQWVGICVFAVLFFKGNMLRKLDNSLPGRFLLAFSFAALFLKYTFELLALYPPLKTVAKSGNHFLLLGYLHLLFLGGVTTFIFWLSGKSGWLDWKEKKPVIGVILFLLGFLGSEAYLFLMGLNVAVPYFTEGLLLFSTFLFAGVVFLAISLRKTSISQPRRIKKRLTMTENKKRSIAGREDISFLVRTFYGKIREDEVLGPIFDSIVEDWESHLEKLTDFWEGNLLFFVKTKFKGDPRTAHQRVDETVENTLTMEHFGRWLNLWIATIDEHFEGETAQLAKNQARKMATFLYLQIFKNRTAEV